MSQQDDPKPANAENAELDTEELDQVSGGAFDAFLKLDPTAGGADYTAPPGLPRP